jgi:siroheme synthase-like protein
MLQLEGRRCVVIGGGRTGLRRAATLAGAGARVTLIAPEVVGDVPEGVEHLPRVATSSDVQQSQLVVLATDDAAVNTRLAGAAVAAGAWVNRADDSDAGDLTFLATRRSGPLMVAVSTGGAGAAAAAHLADQALAALPTTWAQLLTLALPHRRRAQTALPPGPARQALLRRLTDESMHDLLRGEGEAAADQAMQQLVDDAAQTPDTRRNHRG